jgi:hypothetical protein
MGDESDPLARSTRSWERRREGDEPAAAAGAALSNLAHASEAGPGGAFDTGRCVVVATPLEVFALRAAAGATDPTDDVFGLCTIEINRDGQVLVDPLAHQRVVFETADALAIRTFIRDSPFFVFDQWALELIGAVVAEGETSFFEAQSRILTRVAAAASETATQDIVALGREGSAMLELTGSPDDVTPGYACRWIADIVDSVLDIEYQKRVVSGDAITHWEHGDALASQVGSAQRSLPADHRDAAQQVLRHLAPPAC